MENDYDKIRADCWTKALESFGTSRIYSSRMKGLKWKVSYSKAIGIALPVLLGGMVGTYYQYPQVIEWAIILTSPMAIAQLVISTILTVNNGENNLVKYVELSTKNLLLSEDFKQLAKYPPATLVDFKTRHEVLLERERGLTIEDYDLSDKENRKGMRAGLREFQRECVGCKQVPLSMTATNCDVCGNF